MIIRGSVQEKSPKSIETTVSVVGKKALEDILPEESQGYRKEGQNENWNPKIMNQCK